MATNQDDITAINTRFYSLWDDDVIVIADNDQSVPEPTATWCRFSIHPMDSDRASIASRTYKQKGMVSLQVFVPAQLGTAEGWELTEVFTNIFRDWLSPDRRIRFDTPEFRTSTAEKEYFTITCVVPYLADH